MSLVVPQIVVDSHVMRQVFVSPTPLLESAWTINGIAPAAIVPRHRALTSPWMLVRQADPEAFRALDGTVDTYLEHWLTLVGHDRAHRANLFDPGWIRVREQVGPESYSRVARFPLTAATRWPLTGTETPFR